MKIIGSIKKAFTGGYWFVMYRPVGSKEWKAAKAPDMQWCADPFTFEDHGDHYIFVEQYLTKKLKGCIGYFKFDDGKPVNKGILIENKYHMSYPDVFKYNDIIYMIPESSANNSVDLYVADHFPDQWRKEKTLICNTKYVDSTVYQSQNEIYLISYTMTDSFEIHVFLLDMEKKELKLVSKRKYDENTGRPAGRIFIENGQMIRPAQDCSKKYGEAIILYQIDEINRDGEFVEHEIRRLEANSIMNEIKPDRIHQYTSDGTFECIDCYKEKLDLLHTFKILIRSRKRT